MIILDTNVLSEVTRAAPNPNVMQWWQEHLASRLFTTSISRAELFYGIRLMPEGQRKSMLFDATTKLFHQGFDEQILGFDSDAADMYADIAAARRNSGTPMGLFDAMIAAIAKSRGAKLATRNTRDFLGCSVELINPWIA